MRAITALLAGVVAWLQQANRRTRAHDALLAKNAALIAEMHAEQKKTLAAYGITQVK